MNRSWFDRAWRGLLIGTMTLFVVNIGLMIAAVVTSSGLRLVVPVDTDQCWAVLLCSSQVSPALRLRGDSVRDGFSLR